MPRIVRTNHDRAVIALPGYVRMVQLMGRKPNSINRLASGVSCDWVGYPGRSRDGLGNPIKATERLPVGKRMVTIVDLAHANELATVLKNWGPPQCRNFKVTWRGKQLGV